MDRQSSIEHILDHFENPRHKGRMADADVQLGGGNPGCGDLITLYLKIGDEGKIDAVSFDGEGCTISQAGGSIIAEMVEGMTLAEVKELDSRTMMDEMGEDVVKSRVRCATLALGTLQGAVKLYEQNQQRATVGIDAVIGDEAIRFEN